MPSRLRPVFLAALLLAGSAAADIVHLKGGRSMETSRLEEFADRVVIKFDSGGSVTILNTEIEWIELSDKNAALTEVAKRRKPATAEAYCDAARWAALHGLKSQASDAWNDALEKDPSCKAAHEALGHRFHDGRWMTEDDFQVATGHVKRDGKWITKADNEKLEQGWEYVDGKLLAPDDVKKAKGFVKHEGKWVLKKELDEIEAKKAALEKEEKEAEGKRYNPKDDEAILAKYGQGWRVKIGKRYRLVTNVDVAPEKFDDKVVAMMDGFWNFYCDTFDVHPVQKTLHNLVCYATQAQFEAAGGPKGAYGVYSHGDPFRPATLWYMSELRGSSFTSRHEGGHQFVAHYVRGDGEAWFGEGIATTFECRGDVPFYDHLYRWNVVHKAVIDPGGFRLGDLVSGKRNDSSSVYCLGAAVHIYFLEGKDGAYRKAYQEYLKKGDTKSPEALAKAMGQPLETLQGEFEAWAKDLDGKRDKKIIEAGKDAPIPGK
jgi:hypothetical protein